MFFILPHLGASMENAALLWRPCQNTVIIIIFPLQGVSETLLYIVNSQCTMNDLIIYEWKWWLPLVFAIKNLISAILLFGRNYFRSPFHWLLWQCLPAKNLTEQPLTTELKAPVELSSHIQRSWIVMAKIYFDQKLSPNQNLCLFQPLISCVVNKKMYWWLQYPHFKLNFSWHE